MPPIMICRDACKCQAAACICDGFAHCSLSNCGALLQVNQILMNYEWSNISFDSLALENFAPGDAKSAELARPLSVSSANNFWPLYYNRSEDRLLIKNCTMTLGGQVGPGCSCWMGVLFTTACRAYEMHVCS